MFGKQHLQFVLLSAFVALLIVLTSARFAEASAGTVVPLVSTSVPGVSATPRCAPLTNFDRRDFSHSIKIDNQFSPLVPGTQFILDGSINAGGTPTSHRVVFTVTDLTKVINGVRTRVMWDTDTNDGVLAESELAFQAQDDDGNLWVLGEYPEEYDAGVFTGAPNTWISGVQRAKAGVLVPGKPKVGTTPFREGYSPKIDFFDCGQVSALGQTVGNFKNVLVVNEWAPLDPTGGIQQKFYAPGTGLVRIGALGDPEAEVMTLSKIKHLNSDALENVREAALKLEKRAYTVSDVYRQTPPMERTSGD